MITHFINNASGPSDPNAHVTFQYGYFALPSNVWTLEGTGRVVSADYGPPSNLQTNLTVIWVREASTAPTWILRNETTKAMMNITDKKLIYLTLHIAFTVHGGDGSAVPKTVALDFNATGQNTIGGNVTQTLNKYRMRWKNFSDFPASASPQQYCHGSSKQPDDTVVFQQGINVDPMTGTVDRSNAASFVTLSCSLGAPAMVYSWGYPYQGLDTDIATFYFDAGIHMKRASYCGDARYYTWAGTSISISDSKPAHSDIPTPSSNPGVEAWWDRSGAVCVNSEHMRHPSMAPKDINLLSCDGNPYSGPPQPLDNCSFICKGNPLPKCPPSPPPPQLLVDGP